MAGSDNLFEMVVKHEMDGRQYRNVMHYIQAETDPLAVSILSAFDLAAAFWTIYSANARPLMADAVTYNSVLVNEYGPSTYQPAPAPPPPRVQVNRLTLIGQFEYFAPFPVFGLVAGDYLPAFNAFKAQKRSGIPGRKKNGSIHLVGVPEDSTVGNVLTGAIEAVWDVNAVTLLASSLLIAVGGNNYVLNPVIFSAQEIKNLVAVGQTGRQHSVRTQTGTASVKVGTMRRRKKR